jgi:hypothetical protein
MAQSLNELSMALEWPSALPIGGAAEGPSVCIG